MIPARFERGIAWFNWPDDDGALSARSADPGPGQPTSCTRHVLKLGPFFDYANKREGIRVLRALGHDAPWTSDPILQKYRFCNVFREDDTTTQWLRRNIREPFARDPVRVLRGTFIFRWFNRIETGEILAGIKPSQTNLFKDWNPEFARRRLENVRPLVTGAYMIKTPAGMNKLDGILSCIEPFNNEVQALARSFSSERWTLEAAWEAIRQFPYMGDFMAYEVVTDLRHSPYLLHNAIDRNTWANPGPGAARGLDRMLGLPLGTLNRHKQADRRLMMQAMQVILSAAHMPQYWDRGSRKWEMREVEHTLCEFDKYERARLGEGAPKQLFRPRQGG